MRVVGNGKQLCSHDEIEEARMKILFCRPCHAIHCNYHEFKVNVGKSCYRPDKIEVSHFFIGTKNHKKMYSYSDQLK